MRQLEKTSVDPERTVARTLAFAVEQAKTLLDARRVWLFGSRARGTAGRRSDIDLAVEATGSHPQWGAFAAKVEEDAPTLLDLDLVDLASCSDAMREVIMREGILLYGRP